MTTAATPVTVGIVAGEASGDMLGAHLIRALRDARPDLDFVGIAGPKMQAEGARSLVPMEKLSVRGYVEALSALPELLVIRRNLARHFIADRPRLFIGVDAPDFNLGLELKLRRAGIATAHFISPSIWAWRPKRIHAIKRAVDHMLLVFPFEQAIYDQAGVPATYVGHPLAQTLPEHPDRMRARERLKLPRELPVVTLMPGSRMSELHQHAELFVQSARLLAARVPDVTLLAPFVTRDTRAVFEAALTKLAARDLPLRILHGHAHDALEASDAALIASGTATLEAALLDCPMVITYRTPAFTAWWMLRQALLPWIGLPNILANANVVPEITHKAATPEALADGLFKLLADKPGAAAMREAFARMRTELRRDTATLSAQALLPLLR
jgi:lipid-A-disaccharide synthase